MNYLQIIICLVLMLIFSVVSNSQTKIPTPTDKSQLFSDHETYYSVWIGSVERSNHIVFNQDTFSNQEITTAYWNRFNSYYKMMPDKSSDILYIFFDAIENDKDAFCVDYNDVIRSKNLHKWNSSFYEQERFFMDKVCSAVFKSYNKNLITELDSIRSRDQYYRKGDNFDYKKQSALDSINQVKFVEIINEYGYPNRKIVGLEYEAHLFFVLQHSDLEMMEKYYSLIEENVNNGDLTKSYLAYLIDRINMLKKEPQIYGTQNTVGKNGESKLYKVVDINNLNKRRKSFGLQPLNLED